MRLVFKNIKAKNNTILIAFLLLFFLILFSILINFNGLYGQDAYKYLEYTKGLRLYFHSGPVPKDIFFPVFYPILGMCLNLVLPDPVLSLQLLSMISFCFGFVLLGKTTYLIYKPIKRQSISIYLGIFYIFSPYLFRFSLLVMSDMLAMTLCLAVFYYSTRYDHFRIPHDLFLTVLFFLTAVMTRNAALALSVIPLMIALRRFLMNFKVLNLFAILVITFITLLPDYLLRHRFFIFSIYEGHLELSFLAENPHWSILNWFKSGFHGINGYQSYHQPNIIYVFYNLVHPAYLSLGIILLFFLKRKDFSTPVSKWLIFSILLYALFLAGFDSQNMRFLVLSFPLVLIFLFPSFERISGFLYPKKRFKPFIFCILIIQLIFTGYSFASVYKANKNDRKIAGTIRAYPNKTVYAFEVDGVIQGYQLTNKTINIWYEPLKSLEPNSLMVLDTEKVKTQFKGRIVEQNLDFIFRHSHPVVIRSFNEGINLYQLNL